MMIPNIVLILDTQATYVDNDDDDGRIINKTIPITMGIAMLEHKMAKTVDAERKDDDARTRL